MNSLHFSEDVKKHWIVKRDEINDEYIALTGKTALGKKDGIDHIYLIGERNAGLWITSAQINQKIKAIAHKVPLLLIEQLGDIDAVVSVPISELHELCKAAKARKRKKISEEQRQRLQDINPLIRNKMSPTKPLPNASKKAKSLSKVNLQDHGK